MVCYKAIQMRREGGKLTESELDEKGQSRMGLKHKLYNIGGGDFDLSVFTQSNNEQQRFSNVFPQINEPTLEDSEPGDHLKFGEDSGLEQYYGQGVTARNSYEKAKSNSSQVYTLQIKVDQLTQQLALKDAELIKYKNTSQILQKETERLQKELHRKSQVLERQRKEISELKYKESVISSEYQSKNGSSSGKSMMNDSINSFCPQMLSPQQTVELLNQLLKKVCKSNRMMKSLTSDASIKEMLSKMNKH